MAITYIYIYIYIQKNVVIKSPVINALQHAEHLQSTKCIFGVLKGSFYRNSLGVIFLLQKCSAGMCFFANHRKAFYSCYGLFSLIIVTTTVCFFPFLGSGIPN